MHGFIVLDKPMGMTSHDVVNFVRRLTGTRKVGHTGTLDPFATGVLPVALGEGTKVIPFLDESVKEYRAVMKLGEATDTQDCTGSLMRSGDWRSATPDRIEEMSRLFLGRGSQVPPMFSALKKNGIPLYRLARKGEEVHREPRQIEIYSLVVDKIDLPEVAFTVRCSRGVYIRTLAHDMGERLGCGAHLTQLRRTASGPFNLQQALSLEMLAEAADRKGTQELIIACNKALAQLRDIPLTERGAARVSCGIAPNPGDFDAMPVNDLSLGERVRLSRHGLLCAVAESTASDKADGEKTLKLLRVFDEQN